MTGIKRINSRAELLALKKELGVRESWHEPDEQEVTATVRGNHFDNAGFWGEEPAARWAELYHENADDVAGLEFWVTLHRKGEPVAEVNLATLFAWATGYESGYSAFVTTEAKIQAKQAASRLELAASQLQGQADQLRSLADK